MKPGYPAPPPPGRVYGMMGAQEMSALGAMHKFVTAQTLLEYRWPLEGKDSEHYFLQEQVSEYLGVKSFKRRYPDVQRRQVDHEERDFLVEMKVVNVTQADLGLTAIPSVQVSYHIFACYTSTKALITALLTAHSKFSYGFPFRYWISCAMTSMINMMST